MRHRFSCYNLVNYSNCALALFEVASRWDSPRVGRSLSHSLFYVHSANELQINERASTFLLRKFHLLPIFRQMSVSPFVNAHVAQYPFDFTLAIILLRSFFHFLVINHRRDDFVRVTQSPSRNRKIENARNVTARSIIFVWE